MAGTRLSNSIIPSLLCRKVLPVGKVGEREATLECFYLFHACVSRDNKETILLLQNVPSSLLFFLLLTRQ